MRAIHYQALRVLTCVLAVAMVSQNSPLWWIAVVPWAILCVFGILMTIPVVVLIGLGAGAAQADWMSDAFIIGLLLVLPTIFAMAIPEILRGRTKSDGGLPSSPDSSEKQPNKIAQQGEAPNRGLLP